jgi:hypothetical protein
LTHGAVRELLVLVTSRRARSGRSLADDLVGTPCGRALARHLRAAGDSIAVILERRMTSTSPSGAPRTIRAIFAAALVALFVPACGACGEQSEASSGPSARPFHYRWDGGRRPWMGRGRDAGVAREASSTAEDAGS